MTYINGKVRKLLHKLRQKEPQYDYDLRTWPGTNKWIILKTNKTSLTLNNITRIIHTKPYKHWQPGDIRLIEIAWAQQLRNEGVAEILNRKTICAWQKQKCK